MTQGFRVWLTGDQVPPDINVLGPNNFVFRSPARGFRAATPVIEIPFELPKFGELVAAEKERRAAEGARS